MNAAKQYPILVCCATPDAEAFATALELRPDFAECLYLRAMRSTAVGRHEDQRRDAERACELEPGFHPAMSALGGCLRAGEALRRCRARPEQTGALLS